MPSIVSCKEHNHLGDKQINLNFCNFQKKKETENPVFKGLSPGQLACGQDELHSVLLELFISKLWLIMDRTF